MPQVRDNRAFTVVEVVLCLVIVVVLLAVLFPFMLNARSSAKMATCAGNLRQFSAAWAQLLEPSNQFPVTSGDPAWSYGGVEFLGLDRQMRLAASRPLNLQLTDEKSWSLESVNLAYRCPADYGVFTRSSTGALLQVGAGRVFDQFGTSYPANPTLLSGGDAGQPVRPLRLDQVTLPANRLILMGDAEWYFYAAGRKLEGDDRGLEAPWHGKDHTANLLMLDYSVRSLSLSRGETAEYLFLASRPPELKPTEPWPLP